MFIKTMSTENEKVMHSLMNTVNEAQEHITMLEEEIETVLSIGDVDSYIEYATEKYFRKYQIAFCTGKIRYIKQHPFISWLELATIPQEVFFSYA